MREQPYKKEKYPSPDVPFKGNLKNAFSVRAPQKFGNKTVLLIDDVMTTGTTLDEAAKELLRAGAKEVLALTLARTL